MAEVSLSGPVVDQDFDSDTWQAALADESGIVNDWDGSAFRLTRPGSGTVAEIGSTTLASAAKVGGYGIRIPEGTTQSIDIPVSTNAAVGRWDLIVARYSSSWLSSMPRGPVRIHRIAGVEGSGELPSWDNRPYDGVEDVPLHAIRRVQGVSLAASEWRDLRVRIGPNILVPSTGLLPTAALGSRATRDDVDWVRDLVSGTPTWVERVRPDTTLFGVDASQEAATNWQRNAGCRMVRSGQGHWRSARFVAHRGNDTITANSNGDFTDVSVLRLHAADRPPEDIPVTALLRSTIGNIYHAAARITTAGWLVLSSTNPGVTFGPAGPEDTVEVSATYYVP